MNRYLTLLLSVALLLIGNRLYAQQSPNTVKFKVTYNTANQTYTAWAVPDYATPNSNGYSTATTESVSTSQFSLKVPFDFVIQNIVDVNGTWDKAPPKYGPGLPLSDAGGVVVIPSQDYSPAALDPAYAYYAIGKSPTTTNMGTFVIGQPVALFTFQGNGCFGPIQPLPPGDPFIQAAADAYSFNVPNNFNSASGQPSSGNQDPLEQYLSNTGAPTNCATFPPLVTPDIANTTPGKPVSGNVLTNDTDPQGGTLTASLLSQPTSGTVVFNPDGSYTYTPPTNFTGVASFCYSVTNTAGLSASTCVSINVVPDPSPVSNNAPIANNDNTQTTAGTPVTIAVLANDTDPDSATTLNGQLNNPTLVSQPSVGTAVVNANGTVSYTPPANFTGVVTFPYQVCDKATQPSCTTALITVNVQPTPPANTTLAPVAVDDALVTPKDTPKAGTVASNDSDPQGLPLNYTTGQPSSGTVVMSPTGSYTYTPAPGYTGPASFTYSVCNSAGKCDVATVSVLVQSPSNLPPVATPDIANTTPGKPVSGNVLTNDVDPQSGPLTASLISQPTSGTVVFNPDGSYTYTPPTNFTGVASFCYSVTNTAGLSASTCVSINVVPDPSPVSNNAPIANNDNTQTTAGTPVTVAVLANDTDPDSATTLNGQLNNPTLVSQPSVGTAVVNANGTVSYTPPANFTGVVTFPYQVCDKATQPSCTTALITVNVQPTPPANTTLAPVAVDDALLAKKDTPATGTVASNDSDPQGLPLTYTTGQPSSGTVVMSPTGSYTYTPAPGYTGPASFTYAVCNSAAKCDVATVSVLVQSPSNLPPVATPDIANTTPGKPVSGNVLTNDVDPQGGPLTASLISQPTSGTVVFNPDGSYTYTPPTNFTGVASFCYSVTNTAGLSASTCVSINVVPDPSPVSNNAPIANNDNTQTTAGTPVTVAVLANDTDPDSATTLNGQLNNPTLVSQPSVGTAVVNANGTVSYTPPANFTGVVTFPYQVCDKATQPSCTTALITVNVQPTPPANTTLAPVAVDDALLTSVNTPKSGNVSTNDSDPQGLPLTYTTGQPTSGTVIMSPTGSYTYTPAPGYTGPASFTYAVCNSAAKCDVATVSVLVQSPSNLPPVATPDIANTTPGKPVSGNVLTNDVDPQSGPLTASLLSQPTSGTVVFNPDGSYTYTPPTNFTGVASFCYSVTNTAGLSASTCVSINVVPDPSPVSNNAPIANNDNTQTTAGTAVTIAVLANDTDPDSATTLNGQLNNPTLVSQPSVGTAVVNANGTVSYTPPANFTGVVTFPYQVCDKATQPSCTTALVTVNVQPTPPANTTLAPVAVDDALLTSVNTPKSGNVSTNDSDPQGLPLTYTTGQPSSGTVVMSPTGSYTYTPAPGYTGPASFTYSVCNSAAKCDVATVSVLVQAGCSLPAPAFYDVNAFAPTACGNTDGYILMTSLPLSTSVTITYQKNGVAQTYSGTSDANGTLKIPNLAPGTYSQFSYQTATCVSGAYTGTVAVGAGLAPAAITASNLSRTNPAACASATGSIQVSGLTASTSYTLTYSKNGGAVQTLVATSNSSGQISLTALTAGTYSGFTYQKGAGCPSAPSTSTLVLTDPAAPTLAQNQLLGINPTSCGTATGTLSITGLTASTSYTISYSKNGGAAQTVVLTSTASGQITITGLTQGSYQLTGLGTSNCTSALSLPAIILADPAGPALVQSQVSGSNPTSCNTNTGSINLSGLTASTSYSVSYSKNRGAAQTVVLTSNASGIVSIPGLGMGNYQVTGLGTNNCSSLVSLTVTLSDPASPTLTAANLEPTNPTTCGTATGSFAITGLSANVVYTLSYQKDGGAVQTVSLTSDASGVASLTGLLTGSYSNFVLMNSLGCSSAPLAGPISLSNPTLPTPTILTLTGVNASCTGQDGKLLLSGLTAGQTFVFHYQLGNVSQAMVVTATTSGVLSVTGLVPGVYSDFFITQGVCKSGTYAGPISLSATCFPPVATPDIANTTVNKPVPGNVLTNDTDPQGNGLTTSLISQPISGTVVLNPDGSYVYTPPTGFTGVVSFCYRATNSAGLSSTACVSINVNPDPSPVNNNAPVANNDATQTTAGTPVTVAVLANDTDPDSATTLNGQLNNPTLVSQPSVGTAVVNANGTVSYTPPANFTGVVTFPYQVCDKATQPSCTTALITVNVQPTPPANTTLAPVAVDDALVTPKDTPKAGTVASNDSDPQGLPLNYMTGQPSSGTVIMSPTGSYTYTPAPGYTGPASFTYSVCNSAAKCDVATVSVLVQSPSNQPPVVVGEPVVTDMGKPVTVCMPIIDADLADVHSVTVCGQPGTGTGTISTSVNNSTGSPHQVCVTYTPTPTFTGSTTACITVCDASGACTTTIIPITVNPASQTMALPQSPMVIVVPIVTPKDTPAQVCMTIVDPNISDIHSVSVCSSPTKGSATAIVTNTGLPHQLCVTYSPASGSVGADAICLVVCDSTGLCTQVIVPITIVDPVTPGTTPVAPVVTPTPIVTPAGTPIVVCTGITDTIGDIHTATICGQPSSGSATVSVDNVTHALCVTYTPGSTPVSTTLCVQVCDQNNLCTTVIMPVTVLTAPKVLLLPHVWLQGALFGVTSPTGLMRDDLRVKKYLPAASPYTSWTSITTIGPVSNTAVVFGVTGNDAIVDWVFVELRSPSNFSLVVDSRPALVQRDGDIVEIDGISPVAFNASQGSYYVAVRHRNHLGVMTASAIPLSLTGTSVDFRNPATPTYRVTTTSAINQAQVTVMQGVAMWAGNVLYDKAVIYQGTGNDVSPISNQVKGPLNIAGNPSYILNGYYTGDVNLDGRTIYQGTGNDVNYIYLNVTKNHPGNAAAQNFFVIREQLP